MRTAQSIRHTAILIYYLVEPGHIETFGKHFVKMFGATALIYHHGKNAITKSTRKTLRFSITSS